MIGFGGNNLAIGISLHMRDNFTSRTHAARAALNGLSEDTIRMQRRQMEMQRNLNATGAMVGAMAIRGLAGWTKVGAEFDYKMRYVSTIADPSEGMDYDKLSQKAKTLGADTMFTARNVADAMKFMAMAGQDTEAIYNNIAAAVHLAGATMERLEGKGGTADIMTNLMKGFNIEATEKNSMRVADVLTTAITSANTNLWDLHEAMKYSIATASDLNVSLEETAAMIMMMGDAGIQGSMAGTAVENMLRYVTRAVDESRRGRQGDALAKIGLHPDDLKDAQGNLKAMSPLLHTISKATQKLSGNVDYQNILNDIFGVRGKRSASIVLRNMEDFDGYITRLNTMADGRATGNLEAMMNTLEGAGIQLKSSWESFMIAYTEAIGPVLKPLIKSLTVLVKLLTRAAEKPMGKMGLVLATGFIVAKTATMAYRAVVLTLRLAHMRAAQTLTAASAQGVSSWNRLTAAASVYNTTAARSGMMGMMGMAGGGGLGRRAAAAGMGSYSAMTARGSQYVIGSGGRSRFVPRGSMPLGWSVGAGGRMAGIGRMVGRGALPAMLGGMALNMGGDAVGGDLGKGMGIAGDTLGWAGTGAMLGSVIPGIGTLAGGIIGGVGGLMYSLHQNLKETSDEIDKLKEPSGEHMNSESWLDKYHKMKGLGEGDHIYTKGINSSGWYDSSKKGNESWMKNQGIYSERQQTQVVINMDGRQLFDQTIDEREANFLVSLGAM